MTGPGRRSTCASLLLLFSLTACWSSGEPAQDAAGRPTRVTPALGDVRYVSPEGRDAWTGTEQRPWRTLTHSLQSVLAGQTLYVRGGVYREQLTRLDLHAGTPRQRIEVRAYPKERPIVRGLFWLREPSHWTIDGIDVSWDSGLENPPLHMVKLTGGQGWIWRNSEIWGARAGANVLITGSTPGKPAEWSFTNNCVHDLQAPAQLKRGSNLTLGDMTNAGPGQVSRNLFFDAPGGRNISMGEARRGRSGPSGPTDVRVAYNTLYGAAVGIALAGSTSDVSIERNLLGGTTSGTLLRAGKLRGAHNTVRDNLGDQVERFFLRRTGTLRRGPGNILSDGLAVSDASSCRGFRPTTTVSAYGRTAVG